MTGRWQTEALAAFQAGDLVATRAALSAGGAALCRDSLGLQLYALAGAEGPDARAVLEYAAFDLDRIDSGALFNLAVIEQDRGELDRALLHYQLALKLDPVHLGALNNISDLLRRQGRSDEAWTAIERYLDAGGDPAGLEVRIAKIADDCGHCEISAEWFARALEREHGSPQIRWEAAMRELRDEVFDAGWQGYEARRAIFPHAVLGMVRYAAPDWRGESLTGRSLLVHKEQGLGDTLMFASCLGDVIPQAGAVHLAVQPPLARLFRLNFPGCSVWPSASVPGAEDESHQPWRGQAGPFDFQLPFGSLGLATRERTFPSPRPYLAADENERLIWRRRLAELAPEGLRAGLVITARRDGHVGPGVAEGEPKSLPPQLAALLATSGISWFGLHDRATALDLSRVPALGIADTSPWLFDMADTAALIAELDVVVAVDTAVAHLAGAMGKPVLLLLRCHCDWRWGRSRSDSYWYSGIELFRQEREGDWSLPLRRAQQRLAAISGARP